MKDFFKNNWFGVAMAAGFGILGWLTYIGGKFDGKIEAYADCCDMLQETIEAVSEETTN